MKVLGIEFAPLNIPLERRLQTAAVLYYWNSFSFYFVAGLLIFTALLFTKFYFIPLLYVLWYFYERNKCNEGGRRSQWVRRWKLWHYFRDYFPIKMVKTAELDPNKNYIFGYHPHGIIGIGAYSCFATEATDFSNVFPGIVPHLVTLEGNFRFPFHRDYLLSSGVCAASKESIEWILTKKGTGNATVIVVGGAAEALNAHPGTASLVLRRRKGFVKLALKFGASLVPIFAFGENDVYSQIPNPDGTKLRNFQNRMTKFWGFSPPLVYGRGIFQYNLGVLPYRKPITVVVGAPIDLERIPEPTGDDIERTHQLYIEKLTELFEAHKEKYGKNLELRI